MSIQTPEQSSKSQGSRINFPEVEEWAEPVDGEILITDIVHSLRRFVVMSEACYVTVAFWVLLTYCPELFKIAPILAITSPIKGCGKSTLLDVLSCLVHKALLAASITMAAIFRVIEANKPTLLIDEADTFIRENEDLRGVLNSGHRAGGQVLRTVGDNHEVKGFSTFGPKAIALIGKLPETLQDRSICPSLRRKTKEEKVCQFRSNEIAELFPLSRKIKRWISDNSDNIAQTAPTLPDFLFNRTADNWEPLFTIAEVIGGDWPDKISEAAKEIVQANNDDTGSSSLLLLSDIRDVFAGIAADRITSKDLIAQLIVIEDRPWSEWKNGKPITTNQLAGRLKAFGITSNSIRLDSSKTAKGYMLDQFSDAWRRYLPPVPDQQDDVPRCAVSETDKKASETAGCDGVSSSEGQTYEDIYVDDIPF